MGVVRGCDVVWYGRGCNVVDVVWYELYKVVGVMLYHMNGTRVHIIRMIWRVSVTPDTRHMYTDPHSHIIRIICIVQGVRVMALVSHICVMSHVSHIYVMSHVSQICVTHGSHICDIARTPDTRDMICCTTWMMQMTWHVVQHEWYKCCTTWMIQMSSDTSDMTRVKHGWDVSCLTHMCDVSHTCVMSHTHVWCLTHMCDVTRVTSMCDVTHFTHMCVWCHTFHPYVCVMSHVSPICVCDVTRFTHICVWNIYVKRVTSHMWHHTVSLLVMSHVSHMCVVSHVSHICVVSHCWYKECESRHTYVWQKIHTLTHMCGVTHMCDKRYTQSQICVMSHVSHECVQHVYVWNTHVGVKRVHTYVWCLITGTRSASRVTHMCDKRYTHSHICHTYV